MSVYIEISSGNRYAHIIPQNSQNHEKKEQEAKFQTVRIRLDKRILTEKDVIRIIQRELIDPKMKSIG